ncbi:MAG TPA: L-aspartate oxidase [Polyangiaceae bacterium LLY-WYZ-15_(1-7)]|nr:L-aspartate oxidase [Sandaracinus sp.]HJK91709.1 L-aspartate oxidase [Polyangiaceae bacterium LLY-WYZ-15_(1-7)]HJL00751.1 L-aspartate oxidase [Polyangiaceae bacterium LLY-WYZ-15_(1-7)]HJL09120.1 L-aspartate oxidase [Polyangiaceae bacterium LLY-WYZ-15_(1-7)]HJL22959.1 L-aspartate oxidase [Polyangiaceae bacterium LLY-WYZ-15_(1-7)]
MRVDCDFLVIGSGVAGLSFALEASKHAHVTIITKRSRTDSATNWAQGGIAAVLDPKDSFEAHIQDTLGTGGGIAHEDVVEMVVHEGPQRIRELMEIGAEFSRRHGREDELDLTREGGHSARRVVHAGDITGREVQRALLHAAEKSANIRIVEDHMAVDLIEHSRWGGPRRQVVGAYVLEEKTGEVHTYLAQATILAAGGAGKVYLYTSNPDVATGDGVAMAYRAGAQIGNMEFFQFHPTSLFHPKAKSFLISEALRGEGGILRLADGTPFMEAHHEMKDLAPRDVVARAIDYEMKKSGAEHVFLDMTHLPPKDREERFPNIHAECMKYGVDMRTQPIPVVPAAHYMCGGVVVDTQGRTTLPGLWAIGEVTCSGLHGANRLASNSLLEGLVYGRRVAEALANKEERVLPGKVPEWDVGTAVPTDEAVVVSQNWDEIRRFMWNYVGIVRSDKRLQRAARRIALLQDEIREYYWAHLIDRDLIELRNIADVAELIIQCALARKESRGLHYTLDYLERNDEEFGADTVIERGVPARVLV